ncbi:hypothetical protein DPMN_162557 [Dreissena polymorpha]|uniref:Uncharacterized protein n=1 Tax=Dreissena polymorpha TaxID=45954 RepID=A0A9D4ITU0_DREPO|nr:hypothetical protein DPMN_162557 [Dreissena polymorpha]
MPGLCPGRFVWEKRVGHDELVALSELKKSQLSGGGPSCAKSTYCPCLVLAGVCSNPGFQSH